MRRLAPWLDLGFDIGFYLDWRDPAWKVDPRMPPYHRGAYGYHDDHILARSRQLPAAAYLAERCETLALAVPNSSTWYVSHYVIAQALNDEFNMAEWLHKQSIKLDAWTLDADKPVATANALRLRDAGVDLFTTNTPDALTALLNGVN
jgi:glycerophosphoryl diester phosphodiesterase